MSCMNDLPSMRPHKRRCLLNASSFQQASSSTRTWQRRSIRRSSSLPTYPCSSPSQDYFDNAYHLDTLDEITPDSDLDQSSTSSATLFSPSFSPSSSMNQFMPDDYRVSLEPESRQSSFMYPLHEPGQMTALRIQRLRSRTASVIMSIPATSEDVVDLDEDEDEDGSLGAVASSSSTPQSSKLRRVSGLRDLRHAFRESDPSPVHFASISSFEASKASYKLGILVTSSLPPSSRSRLSPRSSLRTLVDVILPQGSSDLKTLCTPTLSSISISSRFSTKVQSTFSPSLSSRDTYIASDTSQLESPKGYLVPNPSTPRTQRHVSLHHGTSPSRSPGEAVWSCAKISQSAVKRAARRGHPPRRVFSSPIAGLVP